MTASIHPPIAKLLARPPAGGQALTWDAAQLLAELALHRAREAEPRASTLSRAPACRDRREPAARTLPLSSWRVHQADAPTRPCPACGEPVYQVDGQEVSAAHRTTANLVPLHARTCGHVGRWRVGRATGEPEELRSDP